MIGTCCELADYRRAGEWTEAALRRGVRTTPGDCRIHQAEVLVLRGEWIEAEASARRGADELRAFNRLVHVGEGLYRIGEIRRLMGDVAGAQDLFRQAGELGRDPQPGLSLLLLKQGRADAAKASIERALDEETSKLSRARLLPSVVDIALKAGNLEAARTAADELEAIAETYDAPALHAAAHVARGAMLLATDDPKEAARTLRRAVTHWQDVGAPFEAARARALLAQAIRDQGDDETAALELRAARSTFEKLGAVPDRNAVDDLLAGLAASADLVSERGVNTFLFTDIVRSTDLVSAIGDEAWLDVVRWHDETLRSLFVGTAAKRSTTPATGSSSPSTIRPRRSDAPSRSSVARGPSTWTRLRTRREDRRPCDGGDEVGQIVPGQGCPRSRTDRLAGRGRRDLASRDTVASSGRSFPVSDTREVRLKGISEPVEVVSLDWHGVGGVAGESRPGRARRRLR